MNEKSYPRATWGDVWEPSATPSDWGEHWRDDGDDYVTTRRAYASRMAAAIDGEYGYAETDSAIHENASLRLTNRSLLRQLEEVESLLASAENEVLHVRAAAENARSAAVEREAQLVELLARSEAQVITLLDELKAHRHNDTTRSTR